MTQHLNDFQNSNLDRICVISSLPRIIARSRLVFNSLSFVFDVDFGHHKLLNIKHKS